MNKNITYITVFTMALAFVFGSMSFNNKVAFAVEAETQGHVLEDSIGQVTIVVSALVCDSESDLPNWGYGGPDITSDTATSYASSHPCEFRSDWRYQWKPGPDQNPGDSLGEVGDGWTTIANPTGNDGKTSITLTTEQAQDKVWIRQIAREGYIPFAGNQTPEIEKVSAELYCDTDVYKYDNHDFVLSPQAGNTYYCVAFNVAEEEVVELPTDVCTIPAADGRTVFMLNNDDKKLRSDRLETQEEHRKQIAISLSAGTYDVTLEAFDGYTGRSASDHSFQSNEAWFAILKNATGTEIVRTNPTDDLEDGVEAAKNTKKVNVSLVVSEAASVLVAYHAEGFGDTHGNANSVFPVCAAFDLKSGNGGGGGDGNGTTTASSTITLTLIGANPFTINVGDIFTDPGVTATSSDGSPVTVSSTTDPLGGVVSSTTGTFTIIYTGTSPTAGSASTTRTVNVVATTTGGGTGGEGNADTSGGPVVSSSGGGGGGFGGFALANNNLLTTNGGTSVATSPVLTCPLLTKYMRFGYENDPVEVVKLQSFLRSVESATYVTVTGFFDENTLTAVNAFQTKYMGEVMGPWGASRPSGYVYITTLKKINQIACAADFIISPSEQVIIDAYRARQAAIDAGTITPGEVPVGEDLIGLNGATSSEFTLGGDFNEDGNIAGAAGASILTRLKLFFWNLFKGL